MNMNNGQGGLNSFLGAMGPKDKLFEGSPYDYGDHERQHTHQADQLGPFFFPAYGLFGWKACSMAEIFLGPETGWKLAHTFLRPIPTRP